MLSIEELVGSLEAYEERRRKKWEPLDQAFQAKLDVKGNRQNTQGIEEAEKVKEAEVVAKVTMKTTKSSLVCRIDVVEEKWEVEEVDQATQEWSALNVASTTIMQLIIHMW